MPVETFFFNIIGINLKFIDRMESERESIALAASGSLEVMVSLRSSWT